MIKDRITPELKSKFQDAINKTKDNGEEHGFYICEGTKKISPSELKFGKDRRINLGDPVVACHGKKVQGNFHTHSYFTLFKQKSKFMKKGMSDEDVKKFIKEKHGQYIKETRVKGITLDSPSPKDLLTSILYSCIGKPEGIMCTGSDMGNNKVECWAHKDITKTVCDRAYQSLYQDGKEKEIITYESWMTPLFHKEIIDLKKIDK
jgi:hypothetical protein